jgi:hypothetical protein
LGKPTEDKVLRQKYYDFAEKMWNKFKVIRREITTATSVHWTALVPQNVLKSGISLAETVQQFRKVLFLEWSQAPTSKGSKQQYAVITMTEK